MTRPGIVAQPRQDAARFLAGAIAEAAAAVSFLTRLPITRRATDADRTGGAAFALVGAAIGLIAAVPLWVVGAALPVPAAVLALLVMTIASGGLHLDGLADTADALAAPTRETAERARSDPRVGPIGAAAIVLDLVLGTSLLATIASADPGRAGLAVVVASAASRAAAPVAAWIARRWMRRPNGGLGARFTSRIRIADVVVAVATAFVVVAGAGIDGGNALAFGVGASIGSLAGGIGGTVVVWRRGQLDGDGFGAVVEVVFLGNLLGLALAAAAV